MQNSREAIQAAIEAGEFGGEGLQPSIIFNHEIDLTKAIAFQTAYLNGSWEEKIETWLKEGYIVFRIQTEFHHDHHNTMVYLAKLKTN